MPLLLGEIVSNSCSATVTERAMLRLSLPVAQFRRGDSRIARQISLPDARRRSPIAYGTRQRGRNPTKRMVFSRNTTRYCLSRPHPLAQMGISGYCRPVRLAVEITHQFSERVELSHDVAVNSAANPTGHGGEGSFCARGFAASMPLLTMSACFAL